MYILGISAYYHDSAAALIKDGRVIFAAEEERFTRIKHDNGFPIKACEMALKFAGITTRDLSAIAYYEKPLLKFERILETFIATYPISIVPFIKTMPEWLGPKIKVESNIRKGLNYKGQIYFIPHHLSHAAAGYYPSPFKKAAILTADGTGEHETTTLWLGEKNQIKQISSMYFPDSLGLLYSTFTAFLGFRVNDDEYKVMGMTAYGKPKYVEDIYKTLDLKDDGSFKLNMSYFAYRESFKMWSNKFEKLFGKARAKDGKITQRHKDLAASIQLVTETIYFKILNHLYKETKATNLCIGGGVALNALANGKIQSNTPFKKVYIFGASGDSGGAIGAVSIAYHKLSKKKRIQRIDSLLLGTKFDEKEIENVLKQYKLKYKKCSEKELIDKTALHLANGKVIAWFQNRMEFGPRALGARSILAAPYPKNMKERINYVKIREQFRPFAGSVLEEKVNDFFELPTRDESFPFMNFCFQVKKDKIKNISAITHEDGSCRIQTVNKNDSRYYLLIKKFYEITKIPVILDTSFNLKGEPIVETPLQAVDDFLKTKIDLLVIGNFILSKGARI